MKKYKIEIENATASALETLRSCGIEIEGYNGVTAALRDAVAAKMAYYNGQWARNDLADALKQLEAAEERKKELEALEASLYDEVFKKANKSAKDTAKSIKDINKQISDLDKAEDLEKLKKKYDDWGISVEKLGTAISLLDSTLALLSDNDYKGKIEITTRQLDLAKQKTAYWQIDSLSDFTK